MGYMARFRGSPQIFCRSASRLSPSITTAPTPREKAHGVVISHLGSTQSMTVSALQALFGCVRAAHEKTRSTPISRYLCGDSAGVAGITMLVSSLPVGVPRSRSRARRWARCGCMADSARRLSSRWKIFERGLVYIDGEHDTYKLRQKPRPAERSSSRL